MLPAAEERECVAGGDESTQNTQCDQVETKYLVIKTLPAVEPELSNILDALENGVRGMYLGTLDL